VCTGCTRSQGRKKFTKVTNQEKVTGKQNH
jgi:hypothetical protein